MQVIYDAAEATGLFASAGVGGIKVRMHPFSHYRTGEGSDDFIHVFAHILEGRTPEQKRALLEAVIGKLKELFPDIQYISMNIQDIEKAGFLK